MKNINQTSPIGKGLARLFRRTNLQFCLLFLLGGLSGSRVFAQAALDFDGTNDYVVVPAAASWYSGGQMTLECWVNLNANASWGTFVKNWSSSLGAFHFGLDDVTLKPSIYIKQSNGTVASVVSPNTIPTGTWTHVAFSCDGSLLRLFVNGAQVGSASYNGTLSSSFLYTLLGVKPNNAGTGPSTADPGFLNGKMDDVRFWNSARTPAQISASMNCELAGTESGLVAYYKSNQSSGTVLTDATANAANGTLTNFALSGNTSNWVTPGGVTTGTSCFVGAGLHFDGSDDRVSIPDANSLDLTTDFTLEAWIKPTTLPGGERTIISKNRDVGLTGYRFMAYDNTLAIVVNNGPEQHVVVSTQTLSLNTWTHVAATYSGGTVLTLYINGVQEATQTFSSLTLGNSTQPVNLGSSEPSANAFNGSLDEVRIWSTVRTAAQIQAKRNCELLGTETGLKAYFKSNQNSGTSLPDATANANNGTLNNFALTGTTSNWITPGGVTTGATCFDASISGATSACTSLTLTASGGGTYLWTGGATTAAATFTTSGTYTVTVTAANTATATASQAITVTANVTPAVSISATNTNITTGTSVTFTATPTNGGAAPIYQWKKNAANVGTNATTYTDAALANNDVITCVLTSNATCATPTTGTSNAVTMLVSAAVVGAGLDFDGTNDYVSIPDANSLDFTTDFTFEAWIKPTTLLSGEHFIVAKNRGAGLNGCRIFTSGTQLGILVNSGPAQAIQMSTTNLSLNTWTHVAGVLSGGISLTLYINGVQAGTQSFSSLALTNSTQPVYIGSNETSSSASTNGAIDEVRLWNVARTAAQIQAKMNCELLGTETGLNAYYKFNQSSGTTLTDLTANANNGTLSNFALTGTASNWVAPGGVPTGATCFDAVITGATTGCGSLTLTTSGGGTYSWTGGATTAAATFTTSGTYTVTVTAANTATSTASQAITVTANVTPAISISASATTITAGTSVTFTATPTNGGTTPIYQWKKNAVNVGTNATTYTDAALANNDVVTCVLTSNATCASPTTATSNAVTMTVTAAASISGATSGCASITLTASGGGTYLWTGGATTAAATFTTSGTYTVTVTAASGGATSTASQTITVNSTVAPLVSISATATSITSGTSVTFTATPTNGGTTPIYQWKKNAANVGTNATTYTDAALANNDVVTCVLTSNATCATPTTATSNAITMTVTGAVVTAAITGATSGCGSITLTASGGGTYLWTGGATTAAATFSTTGTYTVTVTAASGGATATASQAITVTANVTPAVSISASATTIVTGTSVTFNATPTNGGTSPVYQWKKNGTNIGTFATHINGGLVNNDVITCVMTSNATCATPTTATSNALTMTVTANNAALAFDGTNDYVNIPHHAALNITGAFSCEAWIKTAATTEQYIFAKGENSYDFAVNGGGGGAGKLSFYAFGVSTAWTYSATSIADGIWHHVAAVRNGTSIQLFIDGNLSTTGTCGSGSISTGTSNLQIGQRASMATKNFNGQIDEVRLWNTARTQGQLQGNRYCELLGTETGLAAYYKFNQPLYSTSLPDLTANANNGTLTNFTLTGTTSNWVAVGGVTSGTTCVNAVITGATVSCLTAITLTASGGATYLWTGGATTAAATFSTSGTYTVTVTTANGSTGTASQTISVNAYVTPSVSISATATNIVSTTSVTFTAVPTNGGAAPVYQWKKNGTNVGTNSATYTDVGLANGNIVSCVMTSNDPCLTTPTATSNSITMTVTPFSGAALDFDGTNDFVSIPHNAAFDITGAFTAEAWIKTTVTTEQYILAKGEDSYILALNGGGYSPGIFSVFIFGATSDWARANNTNVADGNWHHVAVIRDGTSLRLFVDGVLKNQYGINGGNFTTGTSPVTIGYRASAPSRAWKGQLDEVRLWNVARTQAQLQARRTCELVGNETGLKAYYKFNQSGGTTLTDGTANGNNGTLTNFAVTGLTSNWVSTGGVNSGATCIDATISGGNTGCGSITLTASGGGTYLWTGGATTAAASFTTSGTYTVTVTAATGGATATASQAVYINPTVLPAVYITASATLVPLGTIVTFTATTTNGGAPPSYQWKKNGNNVGLNSATYADATLTNGQIITCVMTSSATCPSPASVASNAITMTVTAAVVGAALDFDGVNDYVNIPHNAALNITGAFTIEAWVKTTVTTTQYFLAKGENSFVLGVNGSGTAPGMLSFYANGLSSTWLNSTISVADGVWHHVAVVRNGGNLQMYIDGTLNANGTCGAGNMPTGTSPLTFGQRPSQPTKPWKGQLDEIRIWNTVRNYYLDIYLRRSCELLGTETGLVAYYKFNHSTGTALTDATSNANHGTLNNFYLSGSTSNWVAPGGLTPGVTCFDAVIAGTTPACSSTTLTASGGGNYLWSTGATTAAITVSASGTYYVTVTAANGASSVASKPIVIIPTPAPSLTITASSPTTVEEDITVTFTATPIGGGTNPIFQWKKNGNNVGANSLTYTDVGLVSNDVITCTMGSNAPCGPPVLHTSNTLTMTITPTTVIAIKGPLTACGSTTLKATGGSAYVWSTGATTAVLPPLTTSGTYTVTVTPLGGGAAQTVTAVVTINSIPTPTITGTAIACNTVTLTGTGGATYAWSNGTATAAATFAASGTYSVTATTAAGCSATASQTITVNKATADITGMASGCGVVPLTATGGISYVWTGGATGATATYSAAGTYKVTVTDANGCTATDSHTIFFVDPSDTYYLDGDGDGYGNSDAPVIACTKLLGYILIGGDCDDANAAINPGAEENCDNIDNNCNGILIEQNCPGSNTPVSSACSSRSTVEVLKGQVFFNYGSVANALNLSTISSITVGQPVVGFTISPTVNIGFGFWARFLLAPSAPTVKATEGDLPDRVQVDWAPDPLSPSANSYKVYRDGALLTTVDNETFTFIDFNVLAGQFYTYSVAGVSVFGEGRRGSALGFLNPNGVVTGQIKTFSGNPVRGTVVKLTPTIGTAVSFNGLSTVFTEYQPTYPRSEFTLSTWVKIGDGNPTTENAGIFDFGSTIGKNWWLHAVTPADGTKGVKFGIGKSLFQQTELSYTFPDSTKSDWHYVAASFNGASLLFYIDGELVGTAVGEISADSTILFLGKRSDEGGYFMGKMDELRFFNRQLAQTEIQQSMNQTVSATTDGLVAYWKFDEGTGSKGFDLSSKKIKAHMCGAEWTTDKPDVVNAGVSDATGFYKIEGVNYASGQTFIARPSKSFYYNQSVEFSASNEGRADLTNFDLPDSSTVEITVKNFDFAATQTLLSKQNGSTTHFALNLISGNIFLEMGGASKNFGEIGMGFHRLSFTMKQTGSSTLVAFYKNGTLVGTHTFSGVAADFKNGTVWTLGAKRSGANFVNHFTGLIDELAIFNTLLPLSDIQTFANIGTNVTHPKLHVYFNLNEGEGTVLHDMGLALTGNGSLHGAGFSTVAAISETLPHEFTPSTRLVTLNPSNTSADQIDFIDQSTVPVSGYVRFDGTDCFQKNVEILVNGERLSPPIFTDSTGYFVIDFEPGETGRLSPTYKNHTFYPAFWDLQNVASPVAGILFRNQTQRKIEGQMAGNAICRKSIIPAGAIVKVKVETLDGCLYREQILTNPNGKFKFDKLPPLPFTVAVTEHSNNIIYNYFQLQGGKTVDLEEVSDTTDFIYYSQPQIEMTPLDTNSCGVPMLTQDGKYQTELKVYQQYDGGACYLDTFDLHIENGISEALAFDTLVTTGKYKYKFTAAFPTITPPYQKTITFLASANELENTLSAAAVVLGKRPRQVNFTSTSPQIPFMILRDPPGDGSSVTVEKGSTVCNGWSIGGSIGSTHSAGLQIELGNKTQIIAGTPAVGTITETGFINTTELGVSITTAASVNESAEVCMTATETISTSSGDVIIGEDADVYVGGALNLLFGITDDLRWDTANCNFYLHAGLLVFPDKFATTFLYSGYQIRKVVIPNLELVGDTASVNAWKNILQRNADLKKAATFVKNLSFDAGVTYESSSSIENTKSTSFDFDVNVEASFAQAMGFNIAGAGSVIKLGVALNIGVSTGLSTTVSNTQTVSYTLADDDLKDAFTVNVLEDKVYATPVFKTVAAVSSCPSEDVSHVRRDAVELTVDKSIIVNVDENGKAVFNFTIGNASETDEWRYYTFQLYNENNPNGAVVRIQGTSGNSAPFLIAPGGSQVVTVTVEKGPIAYDYENLLFHAFSQCESDRYDALGNGDFPPAPFYKGILVDVHFLEPCSPIDLGFPLENWVHTPADGPIMFITLNEYNNVDADLELIRVQYRRKQGDGAWINIADVPKASLTNPVFHLVQWNTAGLQDGEYEIRAITQCTGGQNAGISHVISGRFERQPPAIFGLPEPADGVYSAGDEISIRFTEPIRCDLLIQADQFSNNNIGLYNTETGDLIDATRTCSEDKIMLVPKVPNHFIENKVLRVEVDNIKDLALNNFIHTQWEFVNDRNNLNWVDNVPVYVAKYQEEIKTEVRRLENRGGFNQDFEITGAPLWVRIYPKSGTLAPGAVLPITFEFDSTMVFGKYQDTIKVEGALGDEPLEVTARVICRDQNWKVNAADWDYSMNFTLKLNIETVLSTDVEDVVGAFVNGQLRGTAKIQYVPATNNYMAFMTVYSNQFDGETVDFQIWDASACLLYGSTLENFAFEADGLEGSPQTPTVIHTNNMVLRMIDLHAGWNWISFNLGFANNSLGSVLASVNDPVGDLIKGQTQFAQNDATFGWLGSLTSILNPPMYQYRTADPDTIQQLGTLIDPTTVPIPVAAGWNWIGFIPQFPLTVNEALASLTPLNGDLIKSQTQFAQYLAGFGWIGNLQYMEPPNGYLLKMTNAGTLTYPNAPVGGKPGVVGGDANNGKIDSRNLVWQVDATKFEHSQTLIAMLENSGQNVTGKDFELGAFVGNECRGAAKAIWIEPLQAHLFFMTIYANTTGELLKFKFHDGKDIFDLSETMYFSADAAVGTVQNPFKFSSTISVADEVDLEVFQPFLDVLPNPIVDYATIRFRSEKQQNVFFKISDATGRLMQAFDYQSNKGMNAMLWENAGLLPPGVYLLEMTEGERKMTEKIVVR